MTADPSVPDRAELLAQVRRIRNVIRELTGKPPLQDEENQ